MQQDRESEKSRRSKLMQYRAIVRLTRLLKGVDPNKVVFMCFRGRSYEDNPRCISERLHELRPKTEIVWLFKGNAIREMRGQVPDYVRAVSISSRRSWQELATARVWVDNFTKDNLLRGFPKDRQFYMQTWHGDRAIKKICYDAFPGEYRLEEECSVVLTGSEFGQRMYRTAFNYHGAYLNEGSPRNDLLVRRDPADIARVREKLGIPAGVKLLFYAPTYRETTDTIPEHARMDLNRTLRLLEEGGDKWMCLYRAHYLAGGVGLDAVKDRLIDMTRYDSMSELLLISDMLLTDYSSCAMDYCLLDRPVFMYMADFEEYLASRPCYYDPHDTPLKIAHNQEELEALIRAATPESAAENCKAIRDYYGFNETGRATDAACQWIIERLG